MFKIKNVLGFIAFFLFLYFTFEAGIWLLSNKLGISAHCAQVTTLIADNQEKWDSIFTTSFDEVMRCQTETCREKITATTLLALRNSDQVDFFETSYFLRLNSQGEIEKWFLSGDVKLTTPSTTGEKTVVRVLTGQGRPICTQNWKIDGGDTFMTYLNDEPSEAETILPVRSGNTIIGAVVNRFGD